MGILASYSRIAGFGILVLVLAACGREAAPQEPLTESEQMLQAGRQKARTCVGCHGPAGISRVASYPSIAGAPREYLAEQMLAFRSGERHDPMMSSIARNLSDEDISVLSYYFQSLPGPDSAND